MRRDFEGQASTSQQRSHSDAAALFQGSSQTENQILSQWQTSNDEIGHFPSGKNPTFMDQKEQQSSTEQTQQSEEPNSQSDSQMHDLQDMSNQQSMEMGSNNQQPRSEGKGKFQFPFHVLYEIIKPQLDLDRDMQLRTIFLRLKKNEISKDSFVQHLKRIVGDQMLRLSIKKLQTQVARRNSQTAPSQFQSQHQASATQLQMSSSAQIITDLSNPASGGNKGKSCEVENQADSSGMPSKSWMPSLTSPIGPGNSSKALLKKHAVDQKKPMEAPDSSFPSSSKKQKVSAAFMDQSIKNLNDVTAISGVNLREEKEHLFPGHTEDSWVSDASRRVVKEDRLILNKIPLERKLAEIMAKYGLERTSSDVERCLSLCVEERMRGLIYNLIRLSKQRTDIEKPRHITITTSDVKQQIMTKNREAREELERKQAETEKSQKLKEPQSTSQVDGDKDKIENSVRLAKFKKKEVDEMLATATNDAIRAATGVGDMLSRWQLMIEAKPKQGGIALVRKAGRKQVIVPQVVIKDVIAVLERDPQMSRSTLIYRVYDKVSDDIVGE